MVLGFPHDAPNSHNPREQKNYINPQKCQVCLSSVIIISWWTKEASENIIVRQVVIVDSIVEAVQAVVTTMHNQMDKL